MTSLYDDPNKNEMALLEAERLIELGRIEWAENQIGACIDCFQEALQIYRTVGDRNGEGIALGRLGEGYRVQGQIQEAIQCLREASAIARELGNKQAECGALGNLGVIHYSLGDLQEAIDSHKRAALLAREIGHDQHEAITLGNLGNVYRSQGRHETAIEHYTRCIALARKVGVLRIEGINLGNKGDAFMALNRLQEAEEYYRSAISVCGSQIPTATGAFKGSLALLLARRDDFEEALSLLVEGEPLVSPFPSEHAKFLCKKGEVLYRVGDAVEAQAALAGARRLALELGVTKESELSQTIAKLEGLLSDTPTSA